jgi:hypothetical protein
MFASLLRSKKRRPSETTPLLAALHRYRSRQDGVDEAHNDDPGAIAQYDDGDDDEEDDEDQEQHRDGPLLPVFSSTFLGTSLMSLGLLSLCLPY